MKKWVGAIVEHLRGREPHLDLPTDVQATAFQRRVWEELRRIPYGATRTYGEVAKAIGKPTSGEGGSECVREQSDVRGGAVPPGDPQGWDAVWLSVGSGEEAGVAGEGGAGVGVEEAGLRPKRRGGTVEFRKGGVEPPHSIISLAASASRCPWARIGGTWNRGSWDFS